MQTSFSEKQLKNKENKSSEKFLENVFTVECAMLLARLMKL